MSMSDIFTISIITLYLLIAFIFRDFFRSKISILMFRILDIIKEKETIPYLLELLSLCLLPILQIGIYPLYNSMFNYPITNLKYVVIIAIAWISLVFLSIILKPMSKVLVLINFLVYPVAIYTNVRPIIFCVLLLFYTVTTNKKVINSFPFISSILITSIFILFYSGVFDRYIKNFSFREILIILFFLFFAYMKVVLLINFRFYKLKPKMYYEEFDDKINVFYDNYKKVNSKIIMTRPYYMMLFYSITVIIIILIYMKIYLIIDSISPNEPSSFGIKDIKNTVNYIYFSAVTFFTVGFGDISPITDISRLIVFSEMFISHILSILILPTLFILFQEYFKVNQNLNKLKEINSSLRKINHKIYFSQKLTGRAYIEELINIREMFEDSLVLYPRNSLLHNNYANFLYNKLMKNESAYSHYITAIEIDSSFSFAYYNLSICNKKNNQFDEYEKNLKRAKTLNPNLLRYENLLKTILKLRDYEKRKLYLLPREQEEFNLLKRENINLYNYRYKYITYAEDKLDEWSVYKSISKILNV